MFRKLLAGSLFFSALTMVAFARGHETQEAAKSLPKIGDRHYEVGGDRYAPVTIKKASNEGSGKYLKDPMQPSKEAKVQVARPVVRKAKPKAEVRVARAEKNGQMKFKKLSVSGHVSQPRVEFSRDLLPVDRADEPLPQDFYQKVFLPAKDENF